MIKIEKIALGGGCHWCTEAVFQSLLGVQKVEQGFVASVDENRTFSEAVIVHFNPTTIALEVLIEIHLYTHKSTIKHSMRDRYRSAIYTFSKEQEFEAKIILERFQNEFSETLVTEVLPFSEFKPSREQIRNYFYNDPKKPFCKTYINPKLKILLKRFSAYANPEKLSHFNP